MKKGAAARHPLLISRQAGRQMKAKLWGIMLLCAVIGIYDFYTRALGSRWYCIWVAAAACLGLWLYHGWLLRRVSIQVRPNTLRLQGALRGFNISYGRILTVTSATLSQHYKLAEMKRGERRLLEPFWHQACLLVELSQYPPALEKAPQWWLPRYLFGTRRPGLLLVVDDWMALSREIEAARTVWQQQRSQQQRAYSQRTLAAQIMDEYVP